MFNLITSAWLPVRRASGARETIAPHCLTEHFSEDPIVALDFGRPDLDGAVTEFLIGLIAVAMGPKDISGWAAVWRDPPSPEALRNAIAPLSFAFNMDGDGPRCFQDLDVLDKVEPTPILHLLIDYPGENALKLNTDHFNKRSDRSLTAPIAAAALIMLQTWAPAGGKGYRTSIRGGGPLTTLARWLRDLPNARGVTTLWDTAWLNVPEVRERPALDSKLFPWLGPTRTSNDNEVVSPEIMHSLHVFFGMPRRIRLEFDKHSCAVAYRSVLGGMHYPGDIWRHPLSPYYKDAKGQVLPVHPRAGPASYRDWLGILINRDDALRANCINSLAGRLERISVARTDRRFDIVAFGYDQDSAKSRGFVYQSVPWVVATNANTFGDAMASAVAAADATAKAVRYAVQLVRHGEVSINARGDASISVRDEGKKAAEDVYHAFFAQSEPDFRVYLDAVAPLEFFEDGHDARFTFSTACRHIARQIFDAHVDEGAREHGMRRTVLAEKWLGIALNAPNAKSYVFKPLQLTVQEAANG